MYLKRTILTLAIMLVFIPLMAQFYNTGENPASVKWNKIKSKNYTIIFPREIDSLGKRYIWLLENNRERLLKGLNINPRRFPVILNPYTVNSNGMVTWAPKRMELYTQPPANGYSQNWEEQLVYHETRHVGQIDHFSKGIFSVLDKLFGEMINGLGVGVYVARWFMEGDAVIAETEFTNTGRGRDASFLEYYRAAELLGHRRTWNQWRYGSYKNYTPGPYEFGYVMLSTVRYRTNMYDYPGQMLSNVVKRFYNPWANSQFDKKYTGHITQDNLNIGLSFMNKIWKEDLIKRGIFTQTHTLQHKIPRDGYNTNYTNAVSLSIDSTLYVKKSFNNPSSLVLLSNNLEFKKEHTSGEKHLRSFSASANNLEYSKKLNRIYFNEYIPHPRWALKSYNNIFYYDISSNKIKRVTKRNSYNNPSINEETNQMALAQYHIKGGSSLVILDALNGDKIKTIDAPSNGQITSCEWVGNKIYATIITSKGMGLFRIDSVNPSNWETIINEQFSTFESLKFYDNKLYFVSGIDGVSNIYAYCLENNTIERITNSKFGVNDYSKMGNYIFASEVNLIGRKPVFAKIAPQDGIKINFSDKNFSADYKYIIADSLSAQAKIATQQDSICSDSKMSEQEFNNTIEVKRYSKIGNLLHIHSWAPIYVNPDNIKKKNFDDPYESVGIGATIMSQNLLGTATTLLGYSYKKGFHAGHINFTYSGLYPVFEVQANINEEQRYGFKLEKNNDNTISIIRYNHNSPLIETNVKAYIPFNFSSHGWRRSFTPQIEWQFNNNTVYSLSKQKDIFRNQVNAGVQYSQMRPIAQSAIFPKWGGGVVIKGGFSPVNSDLFGQVAAIHTFGYIPGLLPRHGIKLSAGYQRQINENKFFYLDNILSMPRGISDDYYARDYTKLSFDYAIPIYLNDYSIIGGLVYFQRLRINPYIDYAITNKGNLYTYGGEVALDAYFLQIGVPVTIGLRYGHNGGKNYFGFKRNVVQFVFNVSLN